MITYQTEGVEMPHIKKRETTEWVKAVAQTYGKKVGEIAYILCAPTPNNSTLRMKPSFIGSSSMASCTCAASTIKARASGINDKGPGEREIMEQAENKALAMLAEIG